MKVSIDSGEWYPVFSATTRLEHSGGDECDVPEETFKRWEKIMEDFDKMQSEMGKALADNRKKLNDRPVCTKCKKHPSQEAHVCPFKEEIHGDTNTLCDCCATCAYECMREV